MNAPISAAQGTNNTGKNYLGSLVILTSLFFMWGFLTCLNDILIPHLKAVFELNYTQAMLIQFCFFGAYFIISFPAGKIVEAIGYQKGIVVGLLTAAAGTLLFYPAAAFRSYPMFLVALFVMAAGITLLQVAANPYVAILGKPETASSRLNLTQAFNSLGTTIAPYFGALLILSVAAKTAEQMKAMSQPEVSAYRLAEASAVQTPYLFLAFVLFVIAAVFALIKLPKIEAATGSTSTDGVSLENKYSSAWSYRHLVFGAIGIFVYVGAEVSIGSFLVNYLGQPFVAGLKEADAGKLVSLYWGGAMVGRFIGSAIQRKVKPGTVLAVNAIVATVLIILTMVASSKAAVLLHTNGSHVNLALVIFMGKIAMWSILAIGLFNSIMFPTIFTLAIDGLGKHTGEGSGILCMAIVGGAIIPLLQGVLADRVGIQHAFVLPVLCYLYIAYYGVKGHIPHFKN